MQVLYRKELSFFNKCLFYFKITITVGGEKDTHYSIQFFKTSRYRDALYSIKSYNSFPYTPWVSCCFANLRL